MIIALINNYKEIIKLGIRKKDFIKGINKFVDSIIDRNPSNVLIENTCNILNCDRASLIILDKVSDSLIVYSGEGIKKAQIKVPKDKGIVGACFLEGKKIRIDDAYLDKRFNKEVDKKTNYRTRSILCYPLIDKDGECFGVIEAINKLIPPFNEDDEEFLKILAYQAGFIFKNITSNDDYKYLCLKLNIIINYDIEINYIKNKFDFTEKTEDTLLNLFNCVNAAFYFIEDNMIKRYKEKCIYKYDINIGIIGKVIKSKEILTFQNIKNCTEFNSIIDMDTSEGLLTIPILNKKDNIVKGIAQVPYIGKVYQNGKPNENEIKFIKKFRKCAKNWIEKNTI
jgi:adenylate cyclase